MLPEPAERLWEATWCRPVPLARREVGGRPLILMASMSPRLRRVALPNLSIYPKLPRTRGSLNTHMDVGFLLL